MRPIWRRLQSEGFADLVGPASAELDLKDRDSVFAFFAATKPRYADGLRPKVGATTGTLAPCGSRLLVEPAFRAAMCLWQTRYGSNAGRRYESHQFLARVS